MQTSVARTGGVKEESGNMKCRRRPLLYHLRYAPVKSGMYTNLKNYHFQHHQDAL